MFHRYLSKMYDIPSYIYIVGIIIAVLLWAFLGKRYDKNKKWIISNRTILILSIIAIFVITILVRSPRKTGVFLDPRYVLELAKEFPDVYNQMVLNVVLFLPTGLTMPFAVKLRFPVFSTLSVSFLLSLIIEALQYRFSLGDFETSDLILNTFGAFLGVCAYLIYKKAPIFNKN